MLDAGCGSGRVTALLVDMAPQGRVYGVDASPSMAAHAAQALGDRATMLCQDLVELDLTGACGCDLLQRDLSLGPDHEALFARLCRALKPGGRLDRAVRRARGNIDAFAPPPDAVAREPRSPPYFKDWQGPWNYATRDTAERLRARRLHRCQCWLEPKPVTPDEPAAFVRTVCLVRHLVQLPDELREPYIGDVLERMGSPLVLDYVRLNFRAAALWASQCGGPMGESVRRP